MPQFWHMVKQAPAKLTPWELPMKFLKESYHEQFGTFFIALKILINNTNFLFVWLLWNCTKKSYMISWTQRAKIKRIVLLIFVRQEIKVSNFWKVKFFDLPQWAKKLVKSNKSISRKFFYQNPFFAISKMAKNQFLNWEKV